MQDRELFDYETAYNNVQVLKLLGLRGALAIWDVLEKCKKQGHAIPKDRLDLLKGLGLIQKNGEVHPHVQVLIRGIGKSEDQFDVRKYLTEGMERALVQLQKSGERGLLALGDFIEKRQRREYRILGNSAALLKSVGLLELNGTIHSQVWLTYLKGYMQRVSGKDLSSNQKELTPPPSPHPQDICLKCA